MKGGLCGATIILIATPLVSCSGSRNLVNVEPLPSDVIVQRMRERASAIHTLDAEGSLTVESPEQSGIVSFDLFLKIPDTLWMKFSGPFGISVGTLMLTPRRFVLYDPHRNQTITGDANPAALSRMMNLPWSFTDIVDIVTGSFHPIGSQERIVSQTVLENCCYALGIDAENTLPGYASRKEIRVDAGTFVTTQYAEYDQDSRVRLLSQSSRIEIVDGIAMPRVIRVILPQQRQSVTLAYSALRVNQTHHKSFFIPPDAQEVPIEEDRSK